MVNFRTTKKVNKILKTDPFLKLAIEKKVNAESNAEWATREDLVLPEKITYPESNLKRFKDPRKIAPLHAFAKELMP